MPVSRTPIRQNPLDRMVDMDDQYARCRFSITCWTPDLAVVHCLRGLCQHTEGRVRPQIAWGGTTEKAWREAGQEITLRFSSMEFREAFVRHASRLLPEDSWVERGRSDNDPAKRQRRR